jgi:hypothetical protein
VPVVGLADSQDLLLYNAVGALPARVAKLADARDLKSRAPKGA